ncbi:hypothetical protein WA026_021731 [Henosepilachna vigintioctopunctata]|uniref:Phosphopantothenoylcysteine decarboxylase n=1 Tax=Henosepilachna vigintioctopunctata TaxID=420089 RepID=A0AAW1TXU7_9CUCU
MVKILLACTGSVATIKLPILLQKLKDKLKNESNRVRVQVILTERSKHFVNKTEISDVEIYMDEDEWMVWEKRGDPVLHIELAKWADIFLIAPLDANTLSKISNGICDNLLTCVARAWDNSKPFIFCPAMNTKMYEHVLTKEQISKLESWGYKCIPVIEKLLMCGDTGLGAMAEVDTIVEFVGNEIAQLKL